MYKQDEEWVGGACLHFESLFLYFINTFVLLASSCTKSSSGIVRQKGSNSLLRSASHLHLHIVSIKFTTEVLVLGVPAKK